MCRFESAAAADKHNPATPVLAHVMLMVGQAHATGRQNDYQITRRRVLFA
jgi:hypothetical protein